MEYRQLGRSGLKVPALSFGTGTFGGSNEFFERWGQTDVDEATKLIDICVDHGVNFFDTANIYSQGASEEILGAALKGKRNRVLIATKATFPKGASLPDPAGLFNSSLDGNVRRAIDFHEGQKLDEKALKALIRAAVAANKAGARR